MAIFLTNGQFYIAHNQKGAIIKTQNILQAQNFYSVEKAIAQKNKAPSKLKSYYFIDTHEFDVPEPDKSVEPLEQIPQKTVKIKRKHFSEAERKELYNRADGYCQLCGRKITISNFTVDHIVPLGRGGNNDMSNVQAVCKVCNQFKANIFPEQFIDRITEIFMFQMEKQYSDNPTWKMARNMLMELI